jgi:hypothetical protein
VQPHRLHHTASPGEGRTEHVTTAEPLWTIEDVSRYLRIPVETLYQWRRKRLGPPARKIGKHLRYEPRAVKSWFDGQAA